MMTDLVEMSQEEISELAGRLGRYGRIVDAMGEMLGRYKHAVDVMERRLACAREMVLDALGDRWFDEGESFWTIGGEDFVDAIRSPDECLDDIGRALREMFGEIDPRVREALESAGVDSPPIPVMSCPVCDQGNRMKVFGGPHGSFLKCMGCDALATLDADGRLASTPANRETRTLRREVYGVIDLLIDAFGDRRSARRWLLSRHGRIAFMDAEACRRAVRSAREQYCRMMREMDGER